MLLIYNASGLILVAVGLIVGLFIFVLSTLIFNPLASLAAGLLAVAAVWAGLSFAWRNFENPSGAERPWPAIFFIPLPIVAAPLTLVAMFFLAAAAFEGSSVADPRAALWSADERELSAFAATGDVALSNELLTVLQDTAAKEAKADAYHIFTRVKEDSVLVLVKVPNLKNYSDSAREELLALIAVELEANPKTKDKKALIGVKGRYVFGAMQTPPDQVMTGKALDEKPLYDFYGPPVDPESASIAKAAAAAAPAP